MLTAGKKALADAGITEEIIGKLDKRRCGVIIGSALGGMAVRISLDYFSQEIDCSLSSCFKIFFFFFFFEKLLQDFKFIQKP